MLFFLLIIAFLISAAYLFIVSRLCIGLLRKQVPGQPANLKYSIIVAAHNEERVIENCIQCLTCQTLARDRYEIILAADRCTDATIEIASRFRSAGAHFSIMNIREVPPGISPKKNALSRAIARAQYDVIAVTDADCTIPPTWLETLDRYFGNETGLVQGMTTYSMIQGMSPFLFGVQSMDFLSHGIVSAAAIRCGLPINANANNLAFRKKAFEEARGYENIGGIVSGDDDLVLQKIARLRTWRIVYTTDPGAAVTTLPCTSWTAMFEQRKRWGSKTVHYDVPQVAILSLIFAFYAIVATSFMAGFFDPGFFLVFLALACVKILGECMLMIPGISVFGQSHLMPYLIPASIIQLPLVIIAVCAGVFGKFRWKNAVFKRRLS